MATIANGTGRRITTHEAQVKTAAVEVKALTISGKQVTLSVFRQLQDEDLIDAQTAELRGVPWGTVNYFWGECKPDHLHVVWQKGEELRRACVWRAAPEHAGLLADTRERLEDLASEYITWLGVRGDADYKELTYWTSSDARHRLVVNGERITANVVEEWVGKLYYFRWMCREQAERFKDDLVNRDYYQREAQREQEGWQSLHAEAQSFLAWMHDDGWDSPEQVWGEMHRCVARRAAFRAAWAQQYDALAALDQLFIAV